MTEKKTIAVVGAGGLLGSRLTAFLLENECKVVAADIDADAARARVAKHGVNLDLQNLAFSVLDVTDELAVTRFFNEAGSLDGAVNCSYPRNKRYGAHFFDVKLADFNENIALHLGAAFIFAQQCAAFFVKHRRPFSLVNISSIYGMVAPKFEVYNGTPMTMPVEYAAIKSAIIHLNKYIANYVCDSDFRINSVSPGGILDGQPEVFISAYKKHCHGKGMLNVDDVLGAISFLLSDHSKFINGQNLVIDDGFTL